MTKILSKPLYLLKIYSIKTELDRILLLSVCFSTLLLAARIIYTGTLTFIFLEWNLFLAFVPYFISQWVFKKPELIKSKWKFALIFFIWLLFIPNSFYIVTDLFHLHISQKVPLWYNLLMILSFAWNGLLVGILSIRQMEKIVQVLWRKENELLFVYPIMWLNALGIFIGRYLRFNSWDVITNPFRLAIDIFNILLHPFIYKNAWGMIFGFSVFMTLLYLTVKRISKLIW